jgi:hypothetical protein
VGLAGLWELAWAAAREWRADAQLTRMYATAIRADGTFDRARSDVQFVFLSKELSASGPSSGAPNGLRWALSQGKTTVVELKQYPAPPLDVPEPKLCDVGVLLAEGAPEVVVIDTFFTEHEGKPPLISIFSEDRMFMLQADPATCEVRGRSTRAPANELDSGVALVDAGKPFNFAKASAAVEEVLSLAGTCKQAGGPSGQGTVSVRFDLRGHVDEVSFQSGGYGGTETGRCLEQRLRKLQVPAWETGRGFIIKRFTL